MHGQAEGLLVWWEKGRVPYHDGTEDDYEAQVEIIAWIELG